MKTETINKFTSIDTLYLLLLTFFTLELFMVYWINENIRGIRKTRQDNLLIILCYMVIFFIVGRGVIIMLMISSPGVAASISVVFLQGYNSLHFLCNLLFVIMLRRFLTGALEIEPGSKYRFKLIWTLVLGPIYINYNMNRIKEAELEA